MRVAACAVNFSHEKTFVEDLLTTGLPATTEVGVFTWTTNTYNLIDPPVPASTPGLTTTIANAGYASREQLHEECRAKRHQHSHRWVIRLAANSSHSNFFTDKDLASQAIVDFATPQAQTPSVPEPETVALSAGAMLALMVFVRRSGIRQSRPASLSART